MIERSVLRAASSCLSLRVEEEVLALSDLPEGME